MKHPLPWNELCQIVERYQFGDLTQLRSPSDLEAYLTFRENTIRSYGSVQAFIIKERLQWESLTPLNPELFACEYDIKILPNDYPYTLQPGDHHIVVWMRARIPVSAGGHVEGETKHKMESWVCNRFKGIPRDDLLWFKNPTELQSVRDVEHFHVMVHGHEDDLDRLSIPWRRSTA